MATLISNDSHRQAVESLDVSDAADSPRYLNTSSVWHDTEDDDDSESMTSSDSDDTTVVSCGISPTSTTGEGSSASSRSVLSTGKQSRSGWRWSQTWPDVGDDRKLSRSQKERNEQLTSDNVQIGSIPTSHELPPVAATEPPISKRLSSLRKDSAACLGITAQQASLSKKIEPKEDVDVIGFTSYSHCNRPPPLNILASERLAIPIRIKIEEDSSSEESDSDGHASNSSSGSDSEARRRASQNMLQRLGQPIRIPQRQASMIQLGHRPRRPPSLDQINDRVTQVTGFGSAVSRIRQGRLPHSRSVSCPSPDLPHRQMFGQVEVTVTPPTPQMATDRILGVVLKSPKMPSSPFVTDALGNLVAPPFDVAPGRQLIMKERERQAKEWLLTFQSQQRECVLMNVGPGSPVPPIADSALANATFAVAHSDAAFSPSITSPSSETQDQSSTKPTSDNSDTFVATHAPPIPPRRRSFRRCGVLKANDDVPDRKSPSGLHYPTGDSSPNAAAHVKRAAGRSLVARLSLCKGSPRSTPKQLLQHPEQRHITPHNLQIPRKPVPVH